MGQYTPNTFSDNQVLTHTALNTEFSAIATAHNTHATGDFPADSVPVTAVANDESEFYITLTHAGAVGASQAYTDQPTDGFAYLPAAFTLIDVSAVGIITTGCGVKLYYDGSAASNAIELTTSRTGVTDSSPSVTSFAADKLIEIRVETGVGEDASGLTVLLRCKKQHV